MPIDRLTLEVVAANTPRAITRFQSAHMKAARVVLYECAACARDGLDLNLLAHAAEHGVLEYTSLWPTIPPGHEKCRVCEQEMEVYRGG